MTFSEALQSDLASHTFEIENLKVKVLLEKLSVDQEIAKAKRHVARGEIHQACVLYQAIMRQFPDDTRARDELSKLNLLPMSPNKFDVSKEVLNRLVGLYNDGEVDTVLYETNLLTQKFPKVSFIWNLMGASAGQLGQYAIAVSAFKKVIELQPDFAAAHNNLGTALKNQNEYVAAESAYNKAIEINPSYAEAYNNLGQTLVQQGKFKEAIKVYNIAKEIKPDYVEVFHNLGVVFQLIENFEEALAHYEKAVEINPNFAEAHNAIGTIQKERGNLDEALRAYSTAISIDPFYSDAHNNIGAALVLLGDNQNAIMAFNKAISLNPSYVQAYYNLGSIFIRQGNSVLASDTFQRALKINPKYAEAHNGLGLALRDQGDFNEAIEAYTKAIKINPKYAEAYNNLGVVLKEQGRLDEAILSYEKAIDINKEYAEALNNLGRVHLLKKNFIKAFSLTEWRWSSKQGSIGLRLQNDKPTWDGSQRADIFAWREQGIGDEIMYSSMFTELHNKSCKLIVECDRRLIPLYERSFSKQIKFVSDRDDISNSDYDSQIPIGSLPKYLRHTLDDFALVSHGWLKADVAKKKFLHAKLKADPTKKIIGISWHTRTSQVDARYRNISLELLANFLKQIPATFISLQYGDTYDELMHVLNTTGLDIVDMAEIDKFNDIEGLAALIAVCDTVVSIDNATVHLAGAMGVDTKVLLPLSPDERWTLNDNKSYWYDHLTLYRQEQLANWTLPLNRLVKDLSIYRV